MREPSIIGAPVVFLIANEQEARQVMDELDQLEVGYHSARGAGEFVQRFVAGPGVGIIAEEYLQPNVCRAIIDGLSEAPPWHDPLLIVLSTRGAASPADEAGLAERMHVLLAPRPIDGGSLASWVRSGLMARNRQRLVRNYLTERQQVLLDLARSEEQLRVVLKSGRVTTWSHELSAKQIKWSEGAEMIFGRSLDELGDTVDSFLELVHPDDRDAIEAPLRVNDGDELDDVYEFRIVRPDSSVRWIYSWRRAIRDSAGKPTRVVFVGIDVTQQKRVEELLKSNDRRKDEFLAMLGHELRNPLAAVCNAVNLLQIGDIEASDQSLAIEIMDRQLQHMTRLIDDLLDVARVTRGKITLNRRRVCVDELMRRAVETCRPLIEARKHSLDIEFNGHPLDLDADPTRIEQVFTNLLNNAAKYTEPGGKIWFSADRVGSAAIVRVRDTGHGMSPEMIACAFEPFSQADRTLDRSQGGLGIGLTMVKSLVEMHGGSVSVNSAGLGHGCEFCITLPLLLDDSRIEADVPDDEIASLSHTPSPRVLVVEDNPDSAASLHLLLRNWGYNVRTVHDGPSALVAARDYQPQIALLDIGLPGMDGYEVARRLRKQHPTSLRILVALTGYGRDEDQRRSLNAGFDYHMTKPVKPRKLETLLASL